MGIFATVCMVGVASAAPRSNSSNRSTAASRPSTAAPKSKAKRAQARAPAKGARKTKLTAAQRARIVAARRARDAAAVRVVIAKPAPEAPPVQMAAPAAPPPPVQTVADTRPAAKEDRMICKQEEILGTRLKSMRTCRRASEWRRISRGFQAKLKETTDKGGAAYSGE